MYKDKKFKLINIYSNGINDFLSKIENKSNFMSKGSWTMNTLWGSIGNKQPIRNMRGMNIHDSNHESPQNNATAVFVTLLEHQLTH